MTYSFWNEAALEPKRKFRWMLYFAGLPQFIVKSVKKPAFKIPAKAHDFLNYKFNFPGRVTWDPIDFTLIDPVQPDAVASFMQILENSGYQFPDNYNVSQAEGGDDAAGGVTGIKSVTKKSLVTAIGGEIQLVQLASNPSGNNDAGVDNATQAGTAATMVEVEKWIIYNPLITSVDFDSLDYSSEELLNIKVGITYDWAKLAKIERTFPLTAPSLTPVSTGGRSEP